MWCFLFYFDSPFPVCSVSSFAPPCLIRSHLSHLFTSSHCTFPRGPRFPGSTFLVPSFLVLSSFVFVFNVFLQWIKLRFQFNLSSSSCCHAALHDRCDAGAACKEGDALKHQQVAKKGLHRLTVMLVSLKTLFWKCILIINIKQPIRICVECFVVYRKVKASLWEGVISVL